MSDKPILELENVRVGQWVESLIDFAGVEKGTPGLIDELYEGGFFVAWHLAGKPVPDGWVWQGQRVPGQPLRDGFATKNELDTLTAIDPPADWSTTPDPSA